MLKLNLIPQRYTHSIDIFTLPAEHQTAVRNFARENESNCYDYQDGDFYLLLNFDLLAHDATPDSELQKFIDSDDESLMSEEEAANYSEERYPVRWSGCTVLADYIGWLRALRYIHANLPVEAQESKTLALFCWH